MHLTIRMGWHDNNWNGKICLDPENNTYCTGKDSLSRGTKIKDLNKEILHKDEYVSDFFEPANLPPCFWSINAFSPRSMNVTHHHFNPVISQTISEVLKPYSVFTWPTKLSMVHNKEKRSINKFHSDLDTRINNYINHFVPKESIIFFYSSINNPVNKDFKNSVDKNKFLLLGCSVLAELPSVKYFPINDTELGEIRKNVANANFSSINQALQVTHFPDQYVLLPYKEYISYVRNKPDNKNILNEMKVVIDEESLANGFKYVSMNIDDDKCLYVLGTNKNLYQSGHGFFIKA
ncbi:MAG: hypothetical protein M1300_06300 [Epsilonproteobacteria bacterium]|nr:hypothetical protein [Campylobacterota bacterium]